MFIVELLDNQCGWQARGSEREREGNSKDLRTIRPEKLTWNQSGSCEEVVGRSRTDASSTGSIKNDLPTFQTRTGMITFLAMNRTSVPTTMHYIKINWFQFHPDC